MAPHPTSSAVIAASLSNIVIARPSCLEVDDQNLSHGPTDRLIYPQSLSDDEFLRQLELLLHPKCLGLVKLWPLGVGLLADLQKLRIESPRFHPISR